MTGTPWNRFWKKAGSPHDMFVNLYLKQNSSDLGVTTGSLVFSGKGSMPKEVTSVTGVGIEEQKMQAPFLIALMFHNLVLLKQLTRAARAVNKSGTLADLCRQGFLEPEEELTSSNS